jgi:probable HAF family extracellular repeat protein
MSPRHPCRVFASAALLIVATAAHASSLYKVKDLGTLGGDISFGAAITHGKLVVGSSTDTTADPPSYRAFLYRAGVMTNLGALWDGGDSFAIGVNASGQACGYATWTDYLGHAVIYANGGIEDIAAARPDFLVSEANGINSAGHLAGMEYGAKDYQPHAFFYVDGRFTIFDAPSSGNGLNDRDQMVGQVDSIATIFDHGRTMALGSLGGGYSEGNAINDAGEATGWSLMADGVSYHAFVRRRGALHDLGTLGGPQAQGMAINGLGVVVGWAYRMDIEQHAFVAFDGHMVDLNALLDPVSGQGWTLGNASGIDNLGRIVGTGIHDGQYHAFELTPMAP